MNEAALYRPSISPPLSKAKSPASFTTSCIHSVDTNLSTSTGTTYSHELHLYLLFQSSDCSRFFPIIPPTTSAGGCSCLHLQDTAGYATWVSSMQVQFNMALPSFPPACRSVSFCPNFGSLASTQRVLNISLHDFSPPCFMITPAADTPHSPP